MCDCFQFAGPKAATFLFRGVCACRHNLSVSGPLDFRLVIQVLLRPCMILNACVKIKILFLEEGLKNIKKALFSRGI